VIHRTLMVLAVILAVACVVASFHRARKEDTAAGAVVALTLSLLCDALLVYLIVRAW
jgi:hypothetical protein